MDYVFQEITALPEGFSVPDGRTKPWGTAPALMQCRKQVQGPFGVINADDFYGKEGFRLVHHFLQTDRADSAVMEMCMAGYHLVNTLSKYGSVNRGICQLNAEGYLQSISETYNIERKEDGILRGENQQKEMVSLKEESIVSMNMFGLPENFLDVLIEKFPSWLERYGKEAKSEYLLPREVDSLMKEGKARVKVLEDHDRWFGVTYQEDRKLAEEALRECIAKGMYPEQLYR